MVKKIKALDDSGSVFVAAGLSGPVGVRKPGEPGDPVDVQLVRLYLHIAGAWLGGTIRTELLQTREELARTDHGDADLQARITRFQQYWRGFFDDIRPDGRVSVPRQQVLDVRGYERSPQRLGTPWTLTLLVRAWANSRGDGDGQLSKHLDCPDGLRSSLLARGL